MKIILATLSLLFFFSCATKNMSQYSKIEYEAGACFGFCPIFKMQIDPDRTAVIEAEHFTFSDGRSKDEFSKPKEGTFTTTIKEADFDKLIMLLNNLNIKNLQSDYGNKNVSDLPTSYLNVTFKDGSLKKIKDYGKNGSLELKEVYLFLEDLRKTQTWKKVK